LGTEWRQSRWARPPMTIRSPEATVNDILFPPAAGLIRKRLVAPRLRTGTVLVSWILPMGSPCQLVESRWSRYRLSQMNR
jgi:hypothetical protein